MGNPALQHPQASLSSLPSQTSSRIIFDLGMNNGDDSAYYLSKGYRVIAVEANPILATRARHRFEKEIAAGQMFIEEVAIGNYSGQANFWINDERDVFSSIEQTRAARHGMECRSVKVESITFDVLLKKYGIPFYLKLDVEGAEALCLKCLPSFPLPQYVSVEAEKLEYLQLLWQAGYREFTIVDQMRHNSNLPHFGNETTVSRVAKQACWYADRFKNRFRRVSFSRGCSGPLPAELNIRWQTFEEVAYDWLHLYFGYRKRGNLNPFSWYDFHAKAPIVSTETLPLFLLSKRKSRSRRSHGRFRDLGASAL